MGNATPLLVLAGVLLLSGTGFAQSRDPASPKVGSKDRGRELLAVLGPRPHDAAGITPLQQELGRRVRCAATRQEIQDELDVEAAGSKGFYPMPELRAAENEICTPPPQLVLPSLPLAPQPEPKQPVPSPHATFRPETQRTVAQTTPLQPVPSPKPASTAPAYTPKPDYPKADIEANHEGIVLVQLVMGADGSVQSASVAQSSNYPTLDAAALNAARTWRIPAAAGKTIKVPLTFSTH